MAQGSFKAQLEAWAKETEERMDIVHRESAQRVIEIMQEPGPSKATVTAAIAVGAGLGKVGKAGLRGVSKKQFGPISNPGGSGRLPVDTGFLRSSLVVRLGTALPPMKPNPPEGKAFQWDVSEVVGTLTASKITTPILAVYTAAYARKVEYNGARFVALAAQRWPQIVDQVTAEARTRSAG